MSVFASLVEQLADLLQPLFGLSAAAAAIILFTAFVRLLVHPLSRAAARGQKARARIQPRIAELRRRHGRNPEKLQRALLDLHTREKVSPLAGILPSLFQLPAFFVLYHLFSSDTIGGRPNGLLGHELFTAPLGGRWADALGDGGPFGGPGLVYAGLFAVVAAVAALGYRLTRRSMAANAALSGPFGGGSGAEQAPGAGAVGAVIRAMPFMSFLTLVTVAVVPLAAALYIATSTAWGVVERAVLYR
ncbi:membrane protein insertase YidC [Streptomyces hirsutus]|uniref:Membrane protein insertase YidC n=1 Tax=Streptomyces hirsutus TaxID=35620 RepID=A0ABZ1GL01_9ACTN|nr:membrane protein insertase YidC [Streptomyces hirsutus]WSD06839.1 membrane protein insertase YidC [Streptomyces hirsutus]WTD19756.1 membrane protein insertase YidC [Streptomyces hirsutus]